MTTAVCFQCGHLKFGSFMPCDQCQARPRTDDEMIASLAMSDHYFDQPTLEQMGQYIQEHGAPPRLDPESEKVFRRNFEEIKASGALNQLYEELDET
ncbi:hypothetical protein [Gimesia panareensis]|uniref:Uncharacterized protein n=1 Tax=Gimesia panareensis TaxID=2527978 RepID=A0A517Q854_9PLAN|nr:hypothetical protein [Gimesia panareensis]QDT27810.1 hypothetical protein Enr10x_31400 [Gimesia panareensis]QDU49370.1 hypothetical protein Pan110_16940 [Gimesia panareensis]QDV17411.1 hypothetical protein Pan153_20590 [Gimesia panareensis]